MYFRFKIGHIYNITFNNIICLTTKNYGPHTTSDPIYVLYMILVLPPFIYMYMVMVYLDAEFLNVNEGCCLFEVKIS